MRLSVREKNLFKDYGNHAASKPQLKCSPLPLPTKGEMQDLTAFKVEEGRGIEDREEVLPQVQEPGLHLTDGGLQSEGGASTWS